LFGPWWSHPSIPACTRQRRNRQLTTGASAESPRRYSHWPKTQSTLVGEQPFKIVSGLGQALLERDVRFPVEQVACTRNVRLAMSPATARSVLVCGSSTNPMQFHRLTRKITAGSPASTHRAPGNNNVQKFGDNGIEG